jgi:hypothetical protein
LEPFPHSQTQRGTGAVIPAIAPLWADQEGSVYVRIIDGGMVQERLGSIKEVVMNSYSDFNATVAVVATWFKPHLLNGHGGGGDLVSIARDAWGWSDTENWDAICDRI